MSICYQFYLLPLSVTSFSLRTPRLNDAFVLHSYISLMVWSTLPCWGLLRRTSNSPPNSLGERILGFIFRRLCLRSDSLLPHPNLGGAFFTFWPHHPEQMHSSRITPGTINTAVTPSGDVRTDRVLTHVNTRRNGPGIFRKRGVRTCFVICAGV